MAERPGRDPKTDTNAGSGYPDFRLVHRYGPELSERIAGSAQLRNWQLVGRATSVVLAQVHLDGLDRIPATGPLILAVNHRSLMDGTVLFGVLDRVISFMVKAEAFEPLGGLLGRVLLSGAQLPVRRDRLDPGPIRLALTLLERGGVLGIFPEGTRGDGSVATARPGVGYFALKTGAAVVPVAIHGSYEMTRRRSLRRPQVTVSIGQPLPFARVAGPLNRRRWLAATEHIRGELAALVSRTAPVPDRARALSPTKVKS